MKHQQISKAVLTSFLLLMLMLPTSYSYAKDKEPVIALLHGEIMDSQCALDVHSVGHSHEAMTKKGNYGSDAMSCTQHCVREMGGVYVLLVKDKVYRLDDQVQPEAFSGRKVKLSGTVDEKAKTIHVVKIEADK
jgi:hypothetical protein